MTYYVPGLGEKDQDKTIRSLMQVHENTATNTTNITANTTQYDSPRGYAVRLQGISTVPSGAFLEVGAFCNLSGGTINNARFGRYCSLASGVVGVSVATRVAAS